MSTLVGAPNPANKVSGYHGYQIPEHHVYLERKQLIPIYSLISFQHPLRIETIQPLQNHAWQMWKPNISKLTLLQTFWDFVNHFFNLFHPFLRHITVVYPCSSSKKWSRNEAFQQPVGASSLQERYWKSSVKAISWMLSAWLVRGGFGLFWPVLVRSSDM